MELMGASIDDPKNEPRDENEQAQQRANEKSCPFLGLLIGLSDAEEVDKRLG